MGEDLFYGILGNCLCAGICAWRARQLGRNPWLWGLGGFIFAIFAVIALLFIPRQQPQRMACPAQTAGSGSLPAAPVQEVKPDPLAGDWYYVSSKREPIGPLSLEQLKQEFHQGLWSRTTLVWHPEVIDWQPAERFPKLVETLSFPPPLST